MKEIRRLFYSGFILSVILAGCVKEDDSVKVIPLKSKVNGDLSEYVEVPMAEYILDFADSIPPHFKVPLTSVKPFPEDLINKNHIIFKAHFVDENGQKTDSFIIVNDYQDIFYKVLRGKSKSDTIVFIQETFNALPYLGILTRDLKKYNKRLEETNPQQTEFSMVLSSSVVPNYLTTSQISEIVKRNWASFISQHYNKLRIVEGEVESAGASKMQKDEFIVKFKRDPNYQIAISFMGFSKEDIEKAKSFKKGQIVGLKGTCDSNGKSINFTNSTIEWY